jgi:hypothetical protein
MNQDSDFVLRSRIGVVLKPRTITRLEALGRWHVLILYMSMINHLPAKGKQRGKGGRMRAQRSGGVPAKIGTIGRKRYIG